MNKIHTILYILIFILVAASSIQAQPAFPEEPEQAPLSLSLFAVCFSALLGGAFMKMKFNRKYNSKKNT